MPATEHSAARESAATIGPSGPLAGPSGTPSDGAGRGLRLRNFAGATTGICIATAALFLISKVLQPESVSHSSLLGMLPFAAILAIAAIGQTLVVQQGGIDLSVPGMISITVVIMTRYPNGDSGKVLVALLLALAVTLAAGVVSGLAISRIGVTPIVA